MRSPLRAAFEDGDEFVRRSKGAFWSCDGTMASVASSLLVGSPRSYISVVVMVVCLDTCHRPLSPDDSTERGRRRWTSIMLWGATRRGKAIGPCTPSFPAPPDRGLTITNFAHKARNGRRPLRAGIDIVRSARPRPRADGWPTGKRSCCRSRTFMSSTRCRASCATSPGRTSAWSTIS